MIGDRINPGFKSTKLLLDNEDLPGIQALAVRQFEAGASALDVTIGPREATDPEFLAKVVRAIQAAVSVPLSTVPTAHSRAPFPPDCFLHP